MKKFTLFFLAILIASLTYGQSTKFDLEDLYGAWGDTIVVNGGNGFVFLPDSSWMMIIDGHFVGGKEYTEGGQQASNSFTVDFNTTPMTLDLIIASDSKDEKLTIRTIFEFINNDLIRLRMSNYGLRPTKFTGDKSTVVMKKAKEN